MKQRFTEIGMLGGYQPDDMLGDAEFDSWWIGQKKQKERIKETCARYEEQTNGDIQLHGFVYIEDANLLSCFNNKV